MNTPVAAPQPTEEAVAAQTAALHDRKRKLEEEEQPDATIKAVKTEPAADAVAAMSPVGKPMYRKPVVSQEVVVKARGVRLEQNRKVSILFALGEHAVLAWTFLMTMPHVRRPFLFLSLPLTLGCLRISSSQEGDD